MSWLALVALAFTIWGRGVPVVVNLTDLPPAGVRCSRLVTFGAKSLTLYTQGLRLNLIPVTFREACAFIELHHRHNKPPRGMKFCIGVAEQGCLVGVVTAGRPVARSLDDGLTIEINRTCTDGTFNANSMLYGAAWRCAKAMGYTRAITYTQANEPGDSLRAVGWVYKESLEPRGSWAESSVKLAHMRDAVGSGGVARIRWEIKCGGY